MSYTRRRRPFGDEEGPITSPAQVDDEIIVGTVPPKRVDCAALPADSPWRRPGQVCAPSPIAEFFSDLYDKLFPPSPPGTTSAPTPAPPAPAPTSSGPPLLLLAAAGGVGYYLLTRKKRS